MSLPFISLLPSDPLVQIIALLVILVIAWTALRFFLRLATRLFTTGCAIILVIGAILILLRYFR